MQVGESYLGCHIHVDTLVSRTIQPESGCYDFDNRWTCVHVYSYDSARVWVVYLQQNKKKAKAEGNNCHAKTMWRQEKPIHLV